jgi:adenylosuccinate lyase
MADTTPPHEQFQHPLITRYASRDMLRIWSPQNRHSTWRGVWIALAEAEHALGLPVSREQIAALQAAQHDIDFAKAREYEAQFRHDVMAHIHTYGDAAPDARGIIHLGATSMDIVDNADLLLTRDALRLLKRRLLGVVQALADFCAAYADVPTLGFTHLQPAQLTTVGKRASLWLADLVMDVAALDRFEAELKCRGLRGATGTQASFLKLLGDAGRVQQLEQRFAQQLGFADCYPVCGQTYSRKVDVELLSLLGSLASGAHKICNDIRLLAMLKEIEEPFEKNQVGSSAMAYKRNPMRSERCTGLARHLMTIVQSAFSTHAAQMLERTLDDSSVKRIVLPEAFLTADAVAVLLRNILDGLVVYPQMIHARIMAELPFIATEDILMAAVNAGGDRQMLHEQIRQHSHAAAAEVKQHGRPNDLIERLQQDQAFAGVDWANVLDPRRYTGLAAEQTRAFLNDTVRPLLAAAGDIDQAGEAVTL